MSVRHLLCCSILLAWLPLGCTDGGDSTSDDGGGTGGAAAGSGGSQTGGAGAGGAAGEECTYQGIGASDPRPVPLDCETMDTGDFVYAEPQLCVGENHAAFLAGLCGGSPFCSDQGDWGTIEASVDEAFGQVVSAIPIGCDLLGVEVVIELAPDATTGTLSLSGTIDGFEACHGVDVTCSLGAITYDLDVSESNCAEPELWYCGFDEGSNLDLVLGPGGAGGAGP